MKRFALVALVLGGLGLAGVLLLGGERRGVRAPGSAGAMHLAHEADAAPREIAPAAGVPEPAPAPRPTASGSRRSAAHDDRPRIAGRVHVRGGYPPGERADVVAEVFIGAEDEERTERERVEVARDGTFELRVPARTRRVSLQVDSELLYQPAPVHALPGATDVVLVPLYLAVLHGRVLPPLGTAVAELRRARLTLGPDGIQLPGQTWPLAARPAKDGTYLFEHLPADAELTLKATNPWGPEWTARVEPLAPGERRELVIALEGGIIDAGRVLDEHGAPVEGADVRAEALGGRGSEHAASAAPDADGAFELTGLPRGTWKVAPSGDGLLRGAELLVDGTRGDVRDLVLALERGGCVSGTVEWPDGRPAESFMLMAVQPGRGGGGEHEDGRFEQCGIGAEPCTLIAFSREQGLEGEGRLEGVRAGQSGLRIVLDARRVFALHGTVVDVDQEPVDRFTVVASNDRGSHSSRGKQGRFRLEGLDAGTWDIRVESDDHLGASQRVEIGARTDPLSFVLLAAGRIRGTVLDPAGRPVRAELRVTRGERARSFSDVARTDAAGRFDVGATSAPLVLSATCAGFAPSEPVELALAAGDGVDGIVLRLRAACRLEGRVLATDGTPVVGRRVGVSYGAEHMGAETDARGHFALDELPPGPAEVFMFLDDGSSAREQVTLVAGTTSVELRFLPPDPVHVRGLVTSGGEPVECLLDFSSPSGWTLSESGPDGRFEVTLHRPGTWTVVVSSADGMLRRAENSIPDVEWHDLVLDLDAMPALASFDELFGW
jgi:hypothetical protein